jgi:hypothetical protein
MVFVEYFILILVLLSEFILGVSLYNVSIGEEDFTCNVHSVQEML